MAFSSESAETSLLALAALDWGPKVTIPVMTREKGGALQVVLSAFVFRDRPRIRPQRYVA